jgi:hypothetical protein
MNKNLGFLISLGLDLDLFYSINIGEYDIRLIGDYSRKLNTYLLSKEFDIEDYLYADKPKNFEYKKNNCRILLIKK